MERRPELVAVGSLVIGVALVVAKLVVGLLTGSLGILSEAAHSFLDLAASGFTLAARAMSRGQVRLPAFPIFCRNSAAGGGCG